MFLFFHKVPFPILGCYRYMKTTFTITSNRQMRDYYGEILGIFQVDIAGSVHTILRGSWYAFAGTVADNLTKTHRVDVTLPRDDKEPLIDVHSVKGQVCLVDHPDNTVPHLKIVLDRTADFFTDLHKTRTSRFDNEAERVPLEEPRPTNERRGIGAGVEGAVCPMMTTTTTTMMPTKRQTTTPTTMQIWMITETPLNRLLG